MYLVQESGPHATAGDFRAAGNAHDHDVSAGRHANSAAFRCLTNTVPVGAHRGPGENQFVGLVEPMIDKAARQLNIDRIAIRRINAPDSNGKIGKERGPLTSAFQKEALDKAARLFKVGRSQEIVGPEEPAPR